MYMYIRVLLLFKVCMLNGLAEWLHEKTTEEKLISYMYMSTAVKRQGEAKQLHLKQPLFYREERAASGGTQFKLTTYCIPWKCSTN